MIESPVIVRNNGQHRKNSSASAHVQSPNCVTSKFPSISDRHNHHGVENRHAHHMVYIN